MNIVIDTNILISALIKPDGVIFNLICLLRQQNLLYLSDYSLVELANHQTRIFKSSDLAIDEMEQNKAILLQKIIIITADFISDADLREASELAMDIDKYDIVFVATTFFVNGFLWTGDKSLYDGLKKKGFINILNSNEIKKIIGYE